MRNAETVYFEVIKINTISILVCDHSVAITFTDYCRMGNYSVVEQIIRLFIVTILNF